MSLLLELAACIGAWVFLFLFGWFVCYLMDRLFGIRKHLQDSNRTALNSQQFQNRRDTG